MYNEVTAAQGLVDPGDEQPKTGYIHNLCQNDIQEVVVKNKEMPLVSGTDKKEEVITQTDKKEEVLTQTDKKEEVVTQTDKKEEVVTLTDKKEDQVINEMSIKKQIETMLQKKTRKLHQIGNTGGNTGDKKEEVITQTDKKEEIITQTDKKEEVITQTDKKEVITLTDKKEDQVINEMPIKKQVETMLQKKTRKLHQIGNMSDVLKKVRIELVP